ncbi:MAG: hypothetical protein AAF393_11930 [Pseudomonadota bacterium]
MKPCLIGIKTLACLLLAALLAATSQVHAQMVETRSFNTIQTAINELGTPLYTDLVSGFTDSSSASFSFTTPTRSLTIGYFTSSNGEVVVEENGTEIAGFFGEDRAEVDVQLRAFLTELFRGSTEGLKLEIANTPNDPVAGSPVSLQSRMAAASFENGSSVGPSPLTGGSRGQGTLAYNHLGVGLKSGRYTGPGFSATVSSTLLNYSIPLNDPRWALKLDLPIGIQTINGVQNVSASFGAGLRIPVYDHWTVTPELRLGITRNKTQRVTAKLLNASIISNYRIPLRNGYGITIGNSLTYSKTFGSAYDQTNTINKNGLEITGPFEPKLYGLPTNWQFSVVHTKVGGDPVFIDEWVDVSLSLGTVGSKNNVTWDSVRIGLTYTHANKGVKGLNLNFGYEF